MRLFDGTRPLRDGAKALARLLPKVDRPRTAVIVGAAVVVAASHVAAGVVTGFIIGAVADGERIEGRVVALVVALPSLLLLAEIGRLIGSTVGQSLKRRVDLSLRRRVLSLSLDPSGIAHLEDPELRALQSSARNLSPFSFTPGDAAVELTTGIAVRLQPLLAAAVIAWFQPVLAVLALAVWAFAHLLFVNNSVRLVMGAASTMSTPEMVYLRELVQGPSAAKEVRVFGIGNWFGGRYLDLTRERMDRSLQQRTGDLRRHLRSGSVLGGGLLGGLLWIGLLSTDGRLSVTATSVCVFALLGIFTVPNLFPDVPVMFGTFAIGAVDAAERAAERNVAASAPLTVATADASLTIPVVDSGITFRDVAFCYPGSDRPVLEGFDLHVPAGQRLAIVGLNGAGKTTLVKLLCRLYDPDAGCVEIDGVDVRSIEPSQWRTRLGVVFQDFIHWHLPVHDNIDLRLDTSPGEVDPGARRAALRSGLDAIVDTLPDGWDTPLHPSARGGIDLSGGQWQRVALTRGLRAVEAGASVLVLDEPTANLDPRAELDFYDAVLTQPLATDRPITTILISHRFATVRHADRIVVLDGGKVVEDGTHDELVAARGLYHDLFESQARTYAEASDA